MLRRKQIEVGQIWRRCGREFLYAEIEILDVGKRSVLYRFVTLDGSPHRSKDDKANRYEVSKSAIRMNYRKVE